MSKVNLSMNSPVAVAIQNTASLIANIANQYIVSTSNAPIGISGFVFDVIDIEELHLQSDATDHYIETNSAIQDHVVQKPIEFTLKGYVGELKNIMQQETGNTFYQIAGLAPVIPLLPNFNVQDAQVYSSIAMAAAQAQSVVASIASIASLIPQLIGSQNYQQQAYSQLYTLWVNRTLCTVQTPFGLLTSMLIVDMRPAQSGDTRLVSGFNITFKQITQVSTSVTTTTNPASPNAAGAGTQTGDAKNTVVGGAVASGTEPVQNYPSNSQLGPDDLANRYSDISAPPPPVPAASNPGLPAPELAATIPQNDQIFNTLPTPLVPPLPTPVAPIIPPIQAPIIP